MCSRSSIELKKGTVFSILKYKSRNRKYSLEVLIEYTQSRRRKSSLMASGSLCNSTAQQQTTSRQDRRDVLGILRAKLHGELILAFLN